MDNTVQVVHTMPRRKNDGSKIISVYMSPELHQSVKLAATFDGMTMQDWVVNSLIETLKQRPGITLPIASQGGDSNGSLVDEDEGHEGTNGHHVPKNENEWDEDDDDDDDVYNPNGPMKVEVAYPKRNHKAYKGKVGEMVKHIYEEEKVLVRFRDGEEVIFLDEELDFPS